MKRFFVLLVLALIHVAPIAFMVKTSLTPSPANYVHVFERVDFLRYFASSLFITGAVVTLGLFVNSIAGYAFARLEWPGRRLFLAATLALTILPLEAIAVPLFHQITLLGLRNTYTAQILPFVANALSIDLFYAFFLGFPRELEEAARIDGAGPLRIFVAIVVPSSKPVFATVAVLTFLVQWGSFLWPSMVTSGESVRPLPLAIATFRALPPLAWGEIMAFGVMLVAPVLIVFVVFQRWFVQGVTSTGLKG